MDDFFIEGGKQAYALSNRGPIKYEDSGKPHQDILEVYCRYGFYVLEDVVSRAEVDTLVAGFEKVIDRAPKNKGAKVDAKGQPSIDQEFERATFQFAKPLSDPMGATEATGGRYPVKIKEYAVPADAPNEVILQISGNLQMMDAHLKLYGHPDLLRAAEAINGVNFAPFTDAIWVKPGYYGAAVAWHQDGFTHWDNPYLDAGTHGFNFMAQLYQTNPTNALWIIPESHNKGRVDIKALVAENAASDRLPGAIPLICRAGDVAICNRQIVHCSFPNTSSERRITYVFGFHRRDCAEGIRGWNFSGKGSVLYDHKRNHNRSRIIQLAIEARSQSFPNETPYDYLPMRAEADSLSFSTATCETILKNYNLLDLGI
jgi:hypothetical protein